MVALAPAVASKDVRRPNCRWQDLLASRCWAHFQPVLLELAQAPGYEADFRGPRIRCTPRILPTGRRASEPGSIGDLASLPDGRAVRVKRDPGLNEAAAWQAFLQVGFQPLKRLLISPGTVTEGFCNGSTARPAGPIFRSHRA